MLWQTGIPECLGGVQQPGGLVVSQSFVFSLDFSIFPTPRDLRLEVVDVNGPVRDLVKFGFIPSFCIFYYFSTSASFSILLISP